MGGLAPPIPLYESGVLLVIPQWLMRLEGVEPSVPKLSQPSQGCVYAIPPQARTAGMPNARGYDVRRAVNRSGCGG